MIVKVTLTLEGCLMIRCQWREDERKLLINVDGQVYPCCYLVNTDFENRFINDPPKKQYIMERYETHKDELNVFKNSMDNIQKHEWWTELEESWSDPNKCLRQCRNWCTVKERDDG